MELFNKKVHQRTITVTKYKAGPGKAVVEGRLVDQQFRENFHITGEKRPAGKLHHIIVRLLFDIAHLTIEEIELELLKEPRQECSDLHDSLSAIKGLRISKGFSLKIKSLLGSDRCCT